VTIKLNGIPIGSATVTFVAGPPSTSNPQTQLIVDHSPETANGVNQDKVHLHIVDQWGNIVANTLVNALFYVVPNGDPAALTAVLSGGGGSVMTDANGDVFLTITNITAGTVQIGATINGSVVGNTVNVVFTSDVPDVTNPQTRLVVDVSPAVADGVQQDKIHAHLVDKNGNVVANQTVTMTFSVAGTGTADGTAVLTYTATGKTDASGNVYLTITNIKTGTVDITATVNGNAITYGSPAEVVFISDVPDVTNPETKLVVDVTKQAADGVAQDKIHAHLVDKNGNIVANQTVTMTFSLAGTGTAEGTAVLTYTATVTTDANGNAYLIITNTKVGTVGLTATVNGKAITYGSPATVEFIANPPVANPPSSATDPTYYIVTADNKTADGTSQDMVKVHLTDNTNVVPNWPVTFTITGGSAASTAFFIDPVTGAKTAGTITVSTNAAGEILLPIVDTKVGDVIIKATIVVNGVTEELILSPRTVHFVVGQPSANPPGNPSGGTTFWVDQDNAVADLIAQDILKAHISDDFGNHVGAGVAVVFTITGGPAAANALFYNGGTPITGPITLYTDANGDISFPMIDKTAGGVIVKAELNGVEIHNSPQTAHFIAGPAVPSAPNAPTGMGTWLTVTQNNMAADGKKVDSVKAHITDQYGNPVANETVTFTIITGGGAEGGALFQPGGVATTITIKTDANGNAVAAISDTKAGDVWVVAGIVYGGTPTLIDGSHVVATFTEAPDVNNEDTRLIVIIYQALADGTSTTSVKAHVVDKAGNPLPGWDVTFKIDSGSATIVTPQPVTTDANGDAYITITSTTPGYVLITATVNDESIKFGSPARVKFAPINIYVPRVFTPNGDGNNDVLKPILVGIKEFHYFSVYNRWGNLIFTTEDANRGWDGTFKGVPQPVETYLWIAEGIDVKGSKIVQKGMTSLVK
jgi:adhesin/invasin